MQFRPKPRVRLYRARYATMNGQRGTLLLIAAHPCDALITALDLLGDTMRRVSVRPAA